MDDYSISSLVDSRNEWCIRLLNIFTPLIIDGFNSIWKDAYKLAIQNREKGKYLMVFQNLLSQIPKWSSAIVEKEKNRILENSGCNYLEDLLSCVHIIQLKALSCIRVGQKQKKIDIEIPTLDNFIHNIYINSARKIYTNVYLYETDIPVLQIQKNNRELELIIKECIMETIRESIPTEHILRAYMDETQEEDVETTEEIINVEEPVEETNQTDESNQTNDSNQTENKEEKIDINKDINVITESDNEEKKDNIRLNIDELTKNVLNEESENKSNEKLKFNDVDEAITSYGSIEQIEAPKTIERLEQISEENFARRKAEEEEDDDTETLSIGEDLNLELDNILTLE